MESTKEVIINLFKGRDHHDTCEVCGNDYDKTFEVHINGKTHVFDSFECAIQGLAPVCAHCGCRIIGHGVEADGVFYCCAHCAGKDGIHDLEDRTITERKKSTA
jgi:hypothetical protein